MKDLDFDRIRQLAEEVESQSGNQDLDTFNLISSAQAEQPVPEQDDSNPLQNWLMQQKQSQPQNNAALLNWLRSKQSGSLG